MFGVRCDTWSILVTYVFTCWVSSEIRLSLFSTDRSKLIQGDVSFLLTLWDEVFNLKNIDILLEFEILVYKSKVEENNFKIKKVNLA